MTCSALYIGSSKLTHAYNAIVFTFFIRMLSVLLVLCVPVLCVPVLCVPVLH